MSDAFVAIIRPLRGGAPLLQAPLPPSSLCSFAYFASFVVNKEKSKSGNRERREKGQGRGCGDWNGLSGSVVAAFGSTNARMVVLSHFPIPFPIPAAPGPATDRPYGLERLV